MLNENTPLAGVPHPTFAGLGFLPLLIISPFVQMVFVCYFSDSIESLVYFSFLLYSITIK
jgi:hypothetical protein